MTEPTNPMNDPHSTGYMGPKPAPDCPRCGLLGRRVETTSGMIGVVDEIDRHGALLVNPNDAKLKCWFTRNEIVRVFCTHNPDDRVPLWTGDPRMYGHVEWCRECGAMRFERHVQGAWIWSDWQIPNASATIEKKP